MPHSTSSATWHRGFTLVELLVALLILVLLSMAGYRGLNAVLQARDQVAAETRKWQHLAFFFSRLDQDIAQVVRRTVRDEGGVTQAEFFGHAVVVDDNDAELTFTRAGIPDQSTALLAPQRIAYRLEQGTIILLRWPILDQAPRTNPVRYPLLEGVREFKLRYLDRAGNWQTQWPSAGQATGLPAGVEIALTLSSNEKITRVFALQ